ncbi:MAG: formylglycine-generating enzyme family protein, partial [Verrucomicrobia bacterium]|nr:formylglycine-generating enzyme family protein [Verrucomicrobiota bacterium]
MKVQLISSLVGLALTGAMVYAEEPTISYAIKMEISYTGVLYQSTDGETWTKVEGATNPYYVAMDEAKKLFFCSKDESESKDVTIPLSEDVDLDMIWIRSGTFTMGSPEDELGRYDDETQHEVTLTQGYWLGKYEVTQAQYEAVMGTNPSVTQGDDLPVQKVSWNDAMEFCATLTKIERAAGRLPEGYEYTLPTEAQWEYACRAGTMTALNSGKNLSSTEKCPEMDEVGWYVGNGSNKTHPVGQKLPNAWGLYDMHGNVYEWCLDWYGEDEPASSVTDPTGPETGSTRLIRGGCWNEVAIFCRSAFRNYTTPASSDSYIGFRVALAPVPVPTKDMTIPLSEDVNLDMIWIEPGTFLMGSPEDELGRSTNEVQHQVTLTKGYWLGKYEVTQAQYEAVMGKNPSYWEGADRPVEQVTWNDAVKFCEWLTVQERIAGRLPEGYEYTLPTEAQWEYACRAGTTTAFNNGTNIPTMLQREDRPCPNLDPLAWYYYNSGEYDGEPFP